MLPKTIERAVAPPLKCQGIKTRLVPFVAAHVRWSGAGRWIEPFAGTCAVALNLAPRQAVVADTNPHLIGFYRGLAEGTFGPEDAAEHLWREGDALREEGEAHYYRIRDRFNAHGDPLDFLFLSRSCFNGLIRFNRKGEFNVPFCRKPERFRRAYVTRIHRQVAWSRDVLASAPWSLRVADWRQTLDEVRPDDFVYLDPPYAGRHADYYGQWNEDDADELADRVRALPCGWAVSTWSHNRHRTNDALARRWRGSTVYTQEHTYHVGARLKNRSSMTEALCVHPDVAAGSPTRSAGLGSAA